MKQLVIIAFAVVFAVLGLGLVSVYAAPVQRAGELVRDTGPEGLSGIVRKAGDLYWTVDDETAELDLVRIPLDPATGAPQSWTIVEKHTVAGAEDLEAVAVDPLNGRVWVADEKTSRILEYDPQEKKTLSRLDVTPQLGSDAKNGGIESLAISSDGLTLWTCLQKPRAKDGAFVRLARYSRKADGAGWAPSGVWALPASVDRKLGKAKVQSSISDLAVLPDGKLAVLELVKTKVKKNRSARTRVSVIDLAGAEDVSKIDSLAVETVKPVKVTPCFEGETGLAFYEGIASGPALTDGSSTLLLVSDAEKGGDRKVLALRIRAN